MVRLNWFQRFYWERLAKPRTDRELFRTLISRDIESLMEIGVDDGQRMRKIARLLKIKNPSATLKYIGVDGFESSKDGNVHLSLKQAHQLATQLGFRATLIPGDLDTAVALAARKVGSCDLVVVNSGFDASQPGDGPIGKWLQHFTHAESVILARQAATQTLCLVSLSNQASRLAA